MSDPGFLLEPRERAQVTSFEIHARGASARAPADLEPLRGSAHCYRRTRPGTRALTARAPAGSFRQAGDEGFAEALEELSRGRIARAQKLLADRAGPPDGAWVAAALALRGADLKLAETKLEQALAGGRRLGGALRRYGLDATLWLEAPGSLVLRVRPERLSTLLALAQVQRQRGAAERAQASFTRLARLAPGDVGVKLLYCDFLLGEGRQGPDELRRVVGLTDALPASTGAGAPLRLFRARALRLLGRSGRARDLCSRVLDRSRGRSSALRVALLLERAAACSDLHEHARAEQDLERALQLDPKLVARAQKGDLGLGVGS